MKRSLLVALVCAALAMAGAPPGVAQPSGDVKVSDHAYVRHDGGTDDSIADCSTNNRQQNEPAAAVSPQNGLYMTAGANDYCTVPTGGGTWAGFYYSNNGGQTWVDSLLPGYPDDTSSEGQQSPLFGLVNNAGDPVQAWDNEGHLYYGGIGFNRQKPASGSIWVARYNWPDGQTAPDYERTTLVSRGTPSPIFLGIFEDKVMLEVDRGADSPFAGNVYVCWTRFTASGANNQVFLATSSDGGASFKVKKVSESVHGSQFCDIAVTKDGDVYVAWRQFDFKPAQGQMQGNAVVWVKSTDGGKSFTKPAVAQPFLGWDPGDDTLSAPAYGRAKFDACRAADATLGGCAGPDPQAFARDCGDGPLACDSGYVFARANSQVRITADPTAEGNSDEVFVVVDASVPGSQTPTGTTYGTAGPGVGTQASVYFFKTTNGGGSWTTPARIDPQATGHQFFPDIDASDGVLHAVWQDSRGDTSTGPPTTVGDFRTKPISNQWVASNPPGAVSAGKFVGVDAFYATSTNGGGTWLSEEVSTATTNPQFEQFGDRDVPFFGDYNYISSAAGSVLMAWTDSRDTVPGTDPRYTNGDGTDGFDVLQCRTQDAAGTWSADTCPNAGGLDQNIYGAVVSAP
jgi:hypothetical protein